MSSWLADLSTIYLAYIKRIYVILTTLALTDRRKCRKKGRGSHYTPSSRTRLSRVHPGVATSCRVLHTSNKFGMDGNSSTQLQLVGESLESSNAQRRNEQ